MMVLNSRCENFEISHRFAKTEKHSGDGGGSFSPQMPQSSININNNNTHNNNSSSTNNNNNNNNSVNVANSIGLPISNTMKTAVNDISFSSVEYDDTFSVSSALQETKAANRFDVQQLITHEDSCSSLRRATPCHGCGVQIFDRVYYYLRDDNTVWHADCLRCSVCKQCLQHSSTCHVRNSMLYCKPDYAKHFSIRCARCTRQIQPTDWVRRAKNMVYHLACFACDSCKRQLSTGEEFAIVDSKVLCKTHYAEMIDGASSEDGKARGKPKTKRIRTTFTEEQIQVLQANFGIDSNPDSQDLERLAQLTGLSKRVTQVWFQNSRAREKKRQKVAQILAKQQQDSGSTSALEVQTALLLGNNDQSSGSNASHMLFTPDSSDSISCDGSE